ncbi:unnamed protein product [Caenorhabditis angaria]|uniref:sn-1-specific diacylglycerol lipase n=1 Tax=Caenorhabditis angaria TaxID=860376 RepID=A0A9P1N2I1_9PELO|nr:unnamed protein product [Caenorhabditis angaria]
MDSTRRTLVTPLLYLRLPIFLTEIAVTVVSTFHAFSSADEVSSCNLTVFRITIVLEWFLILTAAIGIIIVFHLRESDVEDNTLIAQRSWSRRMRIFKIGQNESMRAALDEVALLISSFFVDSDLVFSDVLAGLLLAYHSPNNQYPPVKEKEYASSRPDWMNIEEAEYYLHHASCVYGWPTYLLYNFRPKSIWNLYKQLQCCGSMRCEETVNWEEIEMREERRNINRRKEKVEEYEIDKNAGILLYKGKSMVVEDNCCYCNTAAVVLANQDRNCDLVYMSFRNRVYEVPFAVIVDHDKKSIIVTIRGSCSLIDLVTDLCLADEIMTVDVDQDATLREDSELDKRGDVRVHRGMLRSARFIFETLEKQNILKNTFVVNPSYQLVVCGHSLGAGVGSLLTMLLKQEYPTIRCYAFAPPGCVISEFGQDEMEKYVMSVVAGDDIVSRMSFQTLHKLRQSIFTELVACKRAKYKILIRGVYQLFFEYPWQDEGLSGVSPADMEAALLQQNRVYGGTESSEQQQQSIPEVPQRIQLYVPGRIVYLSESPENGTQEQWIDPKCLSAIKLSVSVLSDHMPAAVQRFMKNRIQSSSRGEIEIVTSQPV